MSTADSHFSYNYIKSKFELTLKVYHEMPISSDAHHEKNLEKNEILKALNREEFKLLQSMMAKQSYARNTSWILKYLQILMSKKLKGFIKESGSENNAIQEIILQTQNFDKLKGEIDFNNIRLPCPSNIEEIQIFESELQQKVSSDGYTNSPLSEYIADFHFKASIGGEYYRYLYLAFIHFNWSDVLKKNNYLEEAFISMHKAYNYLSQWQAVFEQLYKDNQQSDKNRAGGIVKGKKLKQKGELLNSLKDELYSNAESLLIERIKERKNIQFKNKMSAIESIQSELEKHFTNDCVTKRLSLENTDEIEYQIKEFNESIVSMLFDASLDRTNVLHDAFKKAVKGLK
ncbi:hypothetical protein HX773_11935 [Pantoea sp. B9002]|uniref:hypothetical protein n=1 Tax=Pantoea sp. B9002 TaxID=2726979 RepID=UPI0015A2A7C7|nr:hypothetical protein [Pantoea sp. B9002]NWA61596.1 hypothetical protein [Pantoea sp. B9002]